MQKINILEICPLTRRFAPTSPTREEVKMIDFSIKFHEATLVLGALLFQMNFGIK